MMELLLLLSAFVTALTGAITGARPAMAATEQVGGAMSAVAARAIVPAASSRPSQGWRPLSNAQARTAIEVRPVAILLLGQRRRE